MTACLNAAPLPEQLVARNFSHNDRKDLEYRIWFQPVFAEIVKVLNDDAAANQYDDYLDTEKWQNPVFDRVHFTALPFLEKRRGKYHRTVTWQGLCDGKIITSADSRMIMDIYRLYEEGLLHRLRQCRQCQRWFYAQQERLHFCPMPARCRDAYFRSSPEGKALRAKYMQAYRAQPSAIQGRRLNTKKPKEKKR
jgi:hypothetical protein